MNPAPVFTEANVTARLIAERSNGSLIMPRYTPNGWWECDVCEVTKAGYFREYEVKLTRSDFRADAQKDRPAPGFYFGNEPRPDPVKKHALLASGHVKGPCQFWYVAPQGVIPPAELPAWAGLIEISWYSYGPKDRHPQVMTREINPAPRLHNEKACETVRRGIVLAGYWRFMGGQTGRRGLALPLPAEHPEELE